MKKKLLAILLCITCAVALACGTVGFAAAEIQRSLSDEQIPPKPWVDQIIDIGGGSGEADTIYQKINAGQTFVLAVCAYSANTSSTNFAFIIRK